MVRKRGAPTSAMVSSRSSSPWRLEGVAQLAQAPGPEGVVGAPLGGVEGPSGGADGGVHVGRGAVGRRRPAPPRWPGSASRRCPAGGAPQLAVDQQDASRRSRSAEDGGVSGRGSRRRPVPGSGQSGSGGLADGVVAGEAAAEAAVHAGRHALGEGAVASSSRGSRRRRCRSRTSPAGTTTGSRRRSRTRSRRCRPPRSGCRRRGWRRRSGCQKPTTWPFFSSMRISWYGYSQPSRPPISRPRAMSRISSRPTAMNSFSGP